MAATSIAKTRIPRLEASMAAVPMAKTKKINTSPEMVRMPAWTETRFARPLDHLWGNSKKESLQSTTSLTSKAPNVNRNTKLVDSIDALWRNSLISGVS